MVNKALIIFAIVGVALISSVKTLETFYHYTNDKGAAAIRASGEIRPSHARDGFPAGVHFTNLSPGGAKGKFNVAVNNYDGIAAKKPGKWILKVTNYILVKVNRGVIQRTPVPQGHEHRNLYYFNP